MIDGRGMHRVVTVPPKLGSFEQRVSLCKAWRGKRGEELKQISGIADIDFVHNAGFIGGAWSLESAIKMAQLSIQEKKEDESA